MVFKNTTTTGQRKLMAHVDYCGWSWTVDDLPYPKDWEYYGRTSGECLCDVCWLPFNVHWNPAKQSCSSLIVDCRGRWWKL
jgi:hypothetical protein